METVVFGDWFIYMEIWRLFFLEKSCLRISVVFYYGFIYMKMWRKGFIFYFLIGERSQERNGPWWMVSCTWKYDGYILRQVVYGCETWALLADPEKKKERTKEKLSRLSAPIAWENFFVSPTPQWGAADAEIKVPSGENTELKRSPFKAWSRSIYCHACHAYCQGVLPCLFLPFSPFTCIFSKTSPNFFLCWPAE